MSEKLIGKVLTGVTVVDDKVAILFTFKDGEKCKVQTEGDCCSSSWVEHLELPALGFPATVISVEDQGEVKAEDSSEYDYLRYYITKIVTDKGEIVIDYRNSSNGYYGGYLVWPSEYNV